MRALRFEALGDPIQQLELAEVPTPEPGPGEVRLRMRLRPINPSDLLQVAGVYGRKAVVPAIAGLEGLGVIEALGAGVTGWSVGERVVPLGAQGTWADAMVTPADNLVRLREDLPDDQAAQLIVNPLTAWLMAVEELKLEPGQWLLQTASGSAVGRSLIQLGKLRGFKTLCLVRDPAQITELLALGADAVVSTAAPDWSDQVQALLPKGGAHAAVDAVGGKVGGELLKLLRHGATMLVYGALSMEPLQLPGGQLIFKVATVKGFWLTDWKLRIPKAERDRVLAELMKVMAAGHLTVPVDGTYPLERFREAIAHAQKPGRHGKILLGG
ncbi:MAG TPA: zinc-dependent alcohol dehydrogenase family protein [Holophagaceae bacterium]|nr:zinc-dependent alcohol dehydrogenase family protein [Holophagaceae bacterium]